MNSYSGTYRRHPIDMSRRSKDSPWGFTVWDKDGGVLADGYTKEPMTRKEAIQYAVRAAGLIKNKTP